VVEWHTRSS